MSEPNSIGDRTPNEHNSVHVTRKISKNEHELKKAKRKSNAYMAAEAVQHERDVVTALKRLSIGRSSINVDPDLPFGVDGDFNYNDYSEKNRHRRRSSQDSSNSSNSSSLDDDRERTLINDDLEQEDIRLNAEKLLWVPAKSHPNIAPDQFRRHVQSTIDDMNNKLGDRSPVSSINTKDSIPTLKELTDELDRLSEMAGLAATDAVTLARSLSSVSSSNSTGSSSLLMNEGTNNRFFQDNNDSDGLPNRPTEEDMDQDAPILSEGSSSLKRNKWTTYSRSNRLGKDKPKKAPRSPLADEHQFIQQQQQQQPQQPLSPNLDKELPPSPKDVPERSIPVKPPIEQHQVPENRGRLSRSQSDTTNPAQKRTNHSRNRHAGSLINLENNQPQESSGKDHHYPQNQHNQRRVVSDDSKPLPKSQSHLHQVQQRPSLEQSQRPLSPQHHPQQQQLQQQHQQHHHQQPPQQLPTPPSSQEQSHESKPQASSPAPEKLKKDNSFLKMFKKKRSTSPKNQKILDSTRKVSPLAKSQIINDENRPPVQNESQNSLQSQPQQPQQQKRPSLKSSRSSSFKFSKQTKSDTEGKKESSKLQESVNLVPQKKDDHLKDQSPLDDTSSSFHQTTGQAINEEQHRIQKESLSKKLSLENMKKSTKPNAPVQFTDSAFGFPLPPLSNSTIIMLDYRFPVHIERAIYRLSHIKLANPRRQLRQQVLLSNFMYAYLNLVNHTLYLQQLDENNGEEIEDQDQINIEESM